MPWPAQLPALILLATPMALLAACHAGAPPAPPTVAPAQQAGASAPSPAPAVTPGSVPEPPLTQTTSAVLTPCSRGSGGQDAGPADAQGELSDAALLTYAQSSFSRCAMMFRHVALGRNHGVPVVADFPCSDVCPQYTVRVIHYDVPVEKCDEAGGLVRSVTVPYGIAAVRRAICLPKVLDGTVKGQ